MYFDVCFSSLNCLLFSSPTCQQIHWKAGHKTKCKDFQARRNTDDCETAITHRDSKTSTIGSKNFSAISLVPSHRTSKPIKQPKDVCYLHFYLRLMFFFPTLSNIVIDDIIPSNKVHLCVGMN